MTRLTGKMVCARAAFATLVPALMPLPLIFCQTSSDTGSAGRRQQPPAQLVFDATSEDVRRPIRRISPLALPGGRLVVTAGDVVSMVSPDGSVVWKHTTSGNNPAVAEPVFHPERNEIAVVEDGACELLDAATGELRSRRATTGRAAYIGVKPYRNGYLLQVDMGSYRSKDDAMEAMGSRTLDVLDYWDGTNEERDGWSVNFPIGAELFVAGDRILAVKHQRDGVTVEEVVPALRAR